MKVHTTDGKLFTLTGEDAADSQLLDALDTQRKAYVTGMTRERLQHGSGFQNTIATLAVDNRHPIALEADAGRQTLSALRQLFGLTLTQPTDHRHIGGTSANPEAQEKLSARLVQLNVVTNARSNEVSQREFMRNEMGCTHKPPCDSQKQPILRHSSEVDKQNTVKEKSVDLSLDLDLDHAVLDMISAPAPLGVN
jgi:hypothetical protein